MKQHSASAALHFLHSGESPLSVRSSQTVPQKARCVYDHLTIGLLQCYVRKCSRWINHSHTKDPKYAARLILKKSKRDHVTSLLKELHWLPVKYRIQYKLATLALRHFDGTLPPYLSSSLCTYINHRAPFVLRQKDCSKFQKQTWKPSVNFFLVTLLRLSGTRCRPTWEFLPPSQLSKLT